MAVSRKLFGIFNLLEHKKIYSPLKMRPMENHPEVYPIYKIMTLLQKEGLCAGKIESKGFKSEAQKQICAKYLGKKLKKIRFLLRTDDELVFGEEGCPGASVPAHFQMAADSNKPTCITAGNMFFDDENKLVMINHKSGDFRPAFDTLQHVLPILIQFKIQMGEKLIIEQLNHGGGRIELYEINTYELVKAYTLKEDKKTIAPSFGIAQSIQKFGISQEMQKMEIEDFSPVTMCFDNIRTSGLFN